jgi:hypothetical protein
MNYLVFSIMFLVFGEFAISQTVEVPKNKTEVNALLKKAGEENRANKLYFAESDKCRN